MGYSLKLIIGQFYLNFPIPNKPKIMEIVPIQIKYMNFRECQRLVTLYGNYIVNSHYYHISTYTKYQLNFLMH